MIGLMSSAVNKKPSLKSKSGKQLNSLQEFQSICLDFYYSQWLVVAKYSKQDLFAEIMFLFDIVIYFL
jgi:hypothetical protein